MHVPDPRGTDGLANGNQWENPYATAISYVSIMSFIFACRYLPALKFLFGMLYWTLGGIVAYFPFYYVRTNSFLAIVLAEVAGKLVLQRGLASSFRPKRYYTIPREALESSLEDVEQLINFFVIEFQRVLFAENVTHTISACVAAFLSYYMIRIVPFWGLCLIGTTCIYMIPLIYTTNQELIDHHLANAQDLVNQQTNQISDLASQHTKAASNTVKQYAGDYSAKAQEYIGTSSKRQGSGPINSSAKPKAEGPVSTPSSAPKLSESDFPHAPKQNLSSAPGATSHQEQYEKSPFGGQAVPAS